MKFLFLLLVSSFAPAGEFRDPYVPGCGIYKAEGRLDCGENDCSFTVFAGSKAERKFRLEKISENFSPFNHHAVALRLEVTSAALDAETKDTLPVLVFPEGDRGELELLEKKKCAR